MEQGGKVMDLGGTTQEIKSIVYFSNENFNLLKNENFIKNEDFMVLYLYEMETW